MTFGVVLYILKTEKNKKGESFRMKIGRKIAICMIAVIAILMINIKVQAAQVRVTTDTLRLREEPSTTSSIVALLSIGDVYEVLGEEGDWYKIQAGDEVGYVSKDFVELEGEVSEGGQENEPTEEQPTENETSNPTTTEPTEETTSTNRTINKETNLRSLPLFSAVSIETLRENDEVTVITQKNHWAYVQTETQSGWMLVSCLGDSVPEDNTTNPEETTTPTTNTDTTTTTQQERRVGYINSENVNFRQSNSTSSSIIQRLAINTEVGILSETDTWYQVEINGVTGYVSKDYVSNSRVETTSRSLEVERKIEETEKSEEIEEVAQVEENVEEPTEEAVVTTSKGEEIVALAKTFLGNQYIYAAEGPKNFDCSGFTLYLYKQYGVTLPHSAAAQIKQGIAVERSELKAGDAVFFQDQAKTKVGHVGIYMGDGNFIHSSSAVGEVTITPISKNYYDTRFVGARRYI